MRKLKYNCIYTHFKGDEYLVIGITTDNFDRSQSVRFKGTAIEEASGIVYHIYEICENTYIAMTPEGYLLEGKFVYYQAQYGEHLFYLRDFNVFMSKTDKGKYPTAEQEYRFECTKEE